MEKLCKTEHCTGCTACASVCPKGCIAMVTDEEGFLRPVVDQDTCVVCGLCAQVCPVMNPLKLPNALPKAYAVFFKDESIRLQSSSGGVFTAIAKTVLAEGGAVFGAAYNEQFEVVHICAETEDDLAKLRGAKYAQSRLDGIFPQVKVALDAGQQVLFSGTPCQVGGLKSYLREDYANLLIIDLVCHSVPSPLAWQAYIQHRAQQDTNGTLPECIDLRSKKTGWSRYQYTNRFEYPSGKIHTETSGESLYMRLFVGGYVTRQSCASCQYKGYYRISDFTLGDFWGIWDIAPEMDDNKGTSVLLVHTSKGAQLLESIHRDLILKEVPLEAASAQNPAMIQCAQSNERRTEAFSLIQSGQIAVCQDWFTVSAPSKTACIKQFVKRILRRFHP